MTVDSRQEMRELLSPRQAEVLEYIEMGLTNRQIAGKLFLSDKSIKATCTHLFEKMQVHSRAEAVASAYRRGWFACGLEHVVQRPGGGDP